MWLSRRSGGRGRKTTQSVDRRRRGRGNRTNPWIWIAPLLLVVGLIAGFLLGNYFPKDTEEIPSELTELWEGIDLMAAHPDDPDKPTDVPGVSDDEIAGLDDESVEMLLSEEVVEIALLSDSPRHLFALGRVAKVHEQHEVAFDLLSTAAEAGSAPAYKYVAEYFEDDGDLDYARELLGVAIEMGFEPASKAWDDISVMIDGQSPSTYQPPKPIVSGPDGSIDFNQFHQPELLRALYQGDASLDRVPSRLPSNAPDFLVEAQSTPQWSAKVNRMVATLYTCHMAVALVEYAKGQRPDYLDGVPLLAKYVDANTAGKARHRLTTGEMLVNQFVTDAVGKAHGLKMLTETGHTLTEQPLSIDSIWQAGAKLKQEWLEQDSRTKAMQAFSPALQEQASLDASLLYDHHLHVNAEDAKRIYTTLRQFILSE